MIAEPGHVVLVEPDAVRDGEMRPEHAELIEMRGQGPAVERGCRSPPAPSICDMAVQPDIEFARQTGAAQDEGVGAMVRDRRRDRRAYSVAVERPVARAVADRRQGRLGRREAKRGDPLLERCGSASCRPGIAS